MSLVGTSACSISHYQPTDSRTCLPSSHRAFRTYNRDNSIAAITAAGMEKLPFIEIDIRLTADGELILFHDRRLRTDNYIGSADLSGQEIVSLPPLARRSIRIPNGENVPSLHKALTKLRSTAALAQLDLKPDSKEVIAATIATARATDTADKIIIQCQTEECLVFVRSEYPEVKVLARVFTAEELQVAVLQHPFMVQVDEGLLTREVVERIHDAGAKILIKSLAPEAIDTSDTWNRLCASGVDVVLTDHPLEFRSSRSDVPGEH